MTFGTIDVRGPARPVAALPSPAFARVDVYADASPMLDAWAELESAAPCSIYQTRAFVLPWIETLGRLAGVEPRFVVARDGDRRPAAMMVIALARRGPIRVASFPGGRDSNVNMPLLRRPAAWSAEELLRFLRAAAAGCEAARPDVFALTNQPLAWAGVANPLALLPCVPSPSSAWGTRLGVDPEVLFAAKLSKDARKKLRKKDQKLAGLGDVRYGVARTAEDQRRVLDAYLAQKTARFRERGIATDLAAPEMRAFLEAASAPNGSGIELHALHLGERVVAVYGGAAHARHWSGMFSSFDADEEIARASPGDLLLMRVIAACCAAGVTSFDLGVGEARYKENLCGDELALFDTLLPLTARGRVFAGLGRLRLGVKRRIKRDPRLMHALGRLRRLRAT